MYVRIYIYLSRTKAWSGKERELFAWQCLGTSSFVSSERKGLGTRLGYKAMCIPATNTVDNILTR